MSVIVGQELTSCKRHRGRRRASRGWTPRMPRSRGPSSTACCADLGGGVGRRRRDPLPAEFDIMVAAVALVELDVAHRVGGSWRPVVATDADRVEGRSRSGRPPLLGTPRPPRAADLEAADVPVEPWDLRRPPADRAGGQPRLDVRAPVAHEATDLDERRPGRLGSPLRGCDRRDAQLGAQLLLVDEGRVRGEARRARMLLRAVLACRRPLIGCSGGASGGSLFHVDPFYDARPDSSREFNGST